MFQNIGFTTTVLKLVNYCIYIFSNSIARHFCSVGSITCLLSFILIIPAFPTDSYLDGSLSRDFNSINIWWLNGFLDNLPGKSAPNGILSHQWRSELLFFPFKVRLRQYYPQSHFRLLSVFHCGKSWKCWSFCTFKYGLSAKTSIIGFLFYNHNFVKLCCFQQ
jgi:hypothetical protein